MNLFLVCGELCNTNKKQIQKHILELNRRTEIIHKQHFKLDYLTQPPTLRKMFFV